MISDVRVGIPVIGSIGWLGGVSHMELHVKAVVSLPKYDRPQLFLIVTDETFDNYGLYQPFVSVFDGVVFVGEDSLKVRSIEAQSVIHLRSQDELFDFIDFYFPVNFSVLNDRCAASWIHDFQHRYLPEFFSHQEKALRDELCRRIAANALLAFCSSRSVEKDFRKFYPSSKTHTRVLSLRVSPEDLWYAGDPIAVQKKYNLPDRFILCSNQFWLHKNHRRLFEAIAILRGNGQDVHLACTGQTVDFRSPGYFRELQEDIRRLHISDLVHILGLIPRHDQIQLLRRSLFVVQPSLFEGLSLIVQECRALGKAIILSDLDVHLEHEYGIYFNRESSEDLAQKISVLLPLSQSGPDLLHETVAKMHSADLAKIYAKHFCELVTDAITIFGKSPNGKKDAVQSGFNHCPVMATSIDIKGNLENQRKAIDSWLRMGFKVVSVNFSDDKGLLQEAFPDVMFFTAERKCQNNYAYSGVGLNDVLTVLAQIGSEICGIANPDIYLPESELPLLLLNETKGSLVYVPKVDVEGIAPCHNPDYTHSGCVFFNSDLISKFPAESFCINLPWWDYWLVLIALKQGISIKKACGINAYRILDPVRYDKKCSLAFAQSLAQYIAPSFQVSAESLAKYHIVLTQVIERNSTALPRTVLSMQGR